MQTRTKRRKRMSDYVNVTEIFGCDVFNDAVMEERLPKKVYKKLKVFPPVSFYGVFFAYQVHLLKQNYTIV